MINIIAPPTVLSTPGGSTLMKSLPHPGHAGSRALCVALYPRVSSDKQVRDGYGLSYQEEQMRGFAGARDYRVVEVVTEPGVSRTEFNRPGLDRLRNLARSGRIDAVLAWKRDRYFGDPALRAVFEREMETYGVRLLAMDDAGGDRPEDKFSDGIKDLLAQLEVAKTRERTVSGTRQKARQGKVIVGSRVNYGFKANAARDQYEVDEYAAPIVRRIFRMIGDEGRSIRATANALNDEAIPSPTGGLWTRTQIRQTLLEDSYKPHSVDELKALGVYDAVLDALDPEAHYGVWYYNRRSVRSWRDPVTFRHRTKTMKNPTSEWIAVPVPDMGVGRETVGRARARIKGNVRSSRASGRTWELDGGILRCGACGWRMVPRSTPNGGVMRHYYVCGSYSVKPRVCPAIRYYRAEKLESEVASKLDVWFDNEEAVTAHIQERLDSERHKLLSGDPEVQVKAISERVAKLDRMKTNYRRQQAEDLIGMDDLRVALSDLERQEHTVKEELDKALDRQKHMDRLESDAKLALDFFAACASLGLQNLTREERRDVYRRLGLLVTVKPSGKLMVEGEPNANWLPESSEIAQASLEEARKLDLVIQALQYR